MFVHIKMLYLKILNLKYIWDKLLGILTEMQMSFRYYALQTGETSLWPSSYLDVDKSQYLQHRKRTLSPKL